MIVEIEKELYQIYDRFNVYKTYFVKKDKDGNIIEKKFRWMETIQKRPKYKPFVKETTLEEDILNY